MEVPSVPKADVWLPGSDARGIVQSVDLIGHGLLGAFLSDSSMIRALDLGFCLLFV